ncbi:hypothetical protein Clacol_000133 [Clathrus columnatus]|uniref:Uncharacterized protein n=1 Tax=Clathrus columnatus TaxID=1419009 RepID=A0AAV5A050_9AGAM|nr:hypothetical protein Clacol_000133 [Clathrus columnatus]
MPVFKTISRLSLKRIYGPPSLLKNILEATSSNLEALELVFPRIPTFLLQEYELKTHSAIKLPSLKSLVLDVGPNVLISIMKYTDIPSSLNWEIDCGDLAVLGSTLNIDAFLSFLEKTQKGTHVILSVNEPKFYIQFKQSPRSALLKLRMGSSDKHRRCFDAIFTSISLSDVISCELICCNQGRSFPLWVSTYEMSHQPILSWLIRLERLFIACEDVEELRWFVKSLQPRKVGTTINTPCPILSNLKVGLVTTSGKYLSETLTMRKKAGHVLTRLCVDYDTKSRYQRALSLKLALMKLVGNVEMVGKTVLVRDDTVPSTPSYKRIGYIPRRHDDSEDF